jgi:hypothetical protein
MGADAEPAGVTRFDADTPEDRRALVAAGIRAHRARESPFVTVEAEPASVEDADAAETDPLAADADPADLATGEDPGTGEESEPVPWVQFGSDTLNLDCTDEELDALEGLLGEFPSFRVDELTRPEEAEGTNVRVTARADEARVAEFVDRVFREVYGLPGDYRAWVVEL